MDENREPFKPHNMHNSSDREDSKYDYMAEYTPKQTRPNYDDRPISKTNKNFEQILQDNIGKSSDCKNIAPTFVTQNEDSKQPNSYSYANSKKKQPISKSKNFDMNSSEEDDENEGYNSMEEFQKLEEQCMQSIQKKPSKPVGPSANNSKAKNNKKKLFDNSDSESSEHSDYNEEQKSAQISSSTKRSNVVNKVIYGQTAQPKVKPDTAKKEGIPAELNEILKSRAALLDTSLNMHNINKLEKELMQGLNELNRNKRLHSKHITDLQNEYEKEIEGEKAKIQKKKRVIERQSEAMKTIPNRREREEIDSLQKELKDLQESMKKKQQSNKLTMNRLKKQVSEAIAKNEELIEERENLILALNEGNNDEVYSDQSKETSTKSNSQKYFEDDQKSKKMISSQSTKKAEIKHNQDLHISKPRYEESKEGYKHTEDNNDISHSPQFGIRSTKRQAVDEQFNVKRDNFTKPNYYEEAGEENVVDDEQDRNSSFEDNKAPQDYYDNDDLDPDAYNMKFQPKYHSNHADNRRIIQENVSQDGKIVRYYANQK